MEKFAEEIRSLEVLIERKQREHEALERDIKCVSAELEEFRLKDCKYTQTRISLEQETQRRVNSDAEADRLRF